MGQFRRARLGIQSGNVFAGIRVGASQTEGRWLSTSDSNLLWRSSQPQIRGFLRSIFLSPTSKCDEVSYQSGNSRPTFANSLTTTHSAFSSKIPTLPEYRPRVS